MGFTGGIANAFYGSMNAYLLYGETANGSEYRLTIWAANRPEAIKIALAIVQSNRLVYSRVI